jgi:acyl carrier protein
VLHQSVALNQFFTELGMAEIAEQLFEATERILATYLGKRSSPGVSVREVLPSQRKSPFSGDVVARRRAEEVTGKIAAWALLVASLKLASSPSMDWAQQWFDHLITQAMAPGPDEAAVISATAIAGQVDSYHQSIGNIEQALAGTDETLDDYLKRSMPSAASVIAPSSSHTQTSTSRSVRGSGVEHRNREYDKQKRTVMQWLVQWLAQHLQIDRSQIEISKAFAEYGVDSIMAVELAQDLEDFLQLSRPLDVTLAWNFPTIEALADHLATLSMAASTGGSPSQVRQQANGQIRKEAIALDDNLGNHWRAMSDASASDASGLNADELNAGEVDAGEDLEHLSEMELAEVLAAELAIAEER